MAQAPLAQERAQGKALRRATCASGTSRCSPPVPIQRNRRAHRVRSHPKSYTPSMDSTAYAEREGRAEVGPATGTMMMLHCLFAMVFAAGTLGVLNCLGFVVRSGSCCPASEGYSPCEMWQDCRSLLSFVLGALLCCILTHERQTADGCSKVQLYTCLL
uniref:Uncharacterized protein n=1 Tax=Alexandrium catenella TaxID=2925 RepID=A0A7S1W889_ALECA